MAPSRGYGVCKALFVTKDRRGQEKEKKREGKRRRSTRVPGATGRGGCGEVLCPPAVPPLWPGTDCVSDSPHSSAAACAAALPPSTSSPEVFGPLLGAERAHSDHSLIIKRSCGLSISINYQFLFNNMVHCQFRDVDKHLRVSH